MVIVKGKGVCTGIAFGPIKFYQRKRQEIHKQNISDPAAEILRFESAKKQAVAQLGLLYDQVINQIGESNALIFQIHQMMLEDMDYCESITSIITTQKVNAEYAVEVTAKIFSQMFTDMQDPYMQGRAADVNDVSARLMDVLCCTKPQAFFLPEPSIIAADDLAPSETVQMDKEKILAFVTRDGSSNSHTAILARTMNIPTIISTGDALRDEFDGKEVIVDGLTGTLYVEPDQATTARLKAEQQKYAEHKQLLVQLKGKPNVTLDGQQIKICANIGSPTDLDAVLHNDADGIGLFRSEFLYLESTDYPTEEFQFAVYKKTAEALSGKKVIIRTLDIGADKQADYFGLPYEENPALGLRAIRVCLQQPEIFKTQLRAIYRASAFGNISIMFPMITSLWEIHEIKNLIKEVCCELDSQSVPYADSIELGIMIETPAAAIISDMLAKEVDFFSIGTNDLTQYTLAIDRQNEALAHFCDAHHPAVLRLIKLVTDNAHINGIRVGICGELAADLSLTPTFLAMKVDELSVTPSSILELRGCVRKTDVKKAHAQAASFLDF